VVPLRVQQALAYRLPFLFRQFLQPFPHGFASGQRAEKDHRDFLRLRVVRHPVPYLVHLYLKRCKGLISAALLLLNIATKSCIAYLARPPWPTLLRGDHIVFGARRPEISRRMAAPAFPGVSRYANIARCARATRNTCFLTWLRVAAMRSVKPSCRSDNLLLNCVPDESRCERKFGRKIKSAGHQTQSACLRGDLLINRQLNFEDEISLPPNGKWRPAG
jgi:hypothetical protein